jgi:hypothetical protein
VADIESFFEVVAREVPARLGEIELGAPQPTHWVVIEDATGVEIASVESGEPQELLSSFMKDDVYAAAYVTYVPAGVEHVLAYVLVAEPRTSDVRRSAVVRTGESVTLGPWEHTV